MRLRNILVIVKDIERSIRFYHDLFGLDIVLGNDGNIILTEGLVLQDEKIWKVPVIQKKPDKNTERSFGILSSFVNAFTSPPMSCKTV